MKKKLKKYEDGGAGKFLQGISPILGMIPGVGGSLSTGANLLGGLLGVLPGNEAEQKLPIADNPYMANGGMMMGDYVFSKKLGTAPSLEKALKNLGAYNAVVKYKGKSHKHGGILVNEKYQTTAGGTTNRQKMAFGGTPIAELEGGEIRVEPNELDGLDEITRNTALLQIKNAMKTNEALRPKMKNGGNMKYYAGGNLNKVVGHPDEEFPQDFSYTPGYADPVPTLKELDVTQSGVRVVPLATAGNVKNNFKNFSPYASEIDPNNMMFGEDLPLDDEPLTSSSLPSLVPRTLTPRTSTSYSTNANFPISRVGPNINTATGADPRGVSMLVPQVGYRANVAGNTGAPSVISPPGVDPNFYDKARLSSQIDQMVANPNPNTGPYTHSTVNQLMSNAQMNPLARAGFSTNTAKTGTGNSLKNAANTAGQSVKQGLSEFNQMEMAPLIAGKGFEFLTQLPSLLRGVEQEQLQLNPNAAAVESQMRQRRAHLDPIRNSIMSQRSASVGAAQNNSRSAALRNAMTNAAYSRAGQDLANVSMQEQQMRNQYKADLAGTLNNLGMQEAAERIRKQTADSQNQAAWDNSLRELGRTAGNAGTFAQNYRTNKTMNQEQLQLINQAYSRFGNTTDIKEYRDRVLAGQTNTVFKQMFGGYLPKLSKRRK